MQSQKQLGTVKGIDGKALVKYLSPVPVGILFSLFIDIRFGLTFLICLAVLPLFSIWLAWSASRRVKITTSVSNSVLSKQDTVKLDIQVEYTGVWSFALLRLLLVDDIHLSAADGQTVDFVLGRGISESVSVLYTAQFWGAADMGVRQAMVSDFLHLSAFPVPVDGVAQTVAVLPEIPNLGENELLRSCVETSVTEETEEESERITIGGGVPGYEHRTYVPGDSFRHINWKLSAKRDEYMVRLPEPVSKTKFSLALAPGRSAGSLEAVDRIRDEQLLMECFLGMCRLLVRQSIECSVYYYKDGAWKHETISTRRDLERLQFALASYSFLGADTLPGRLPSHGNGEGVLVFTVNPDGCLQQQTGANVQLVVPAAYTAPVPAWGIDSNFTIARTNS